MDESISRKAVINELERAKIRVSLTMVRQPTHSFERAIGRGTIGTLDDVEKNIRRLPPSESKIGKWIRDGHHIRCDQCGMYMCDTDREGDKIPNNFCPNCGSYNRGEINDQ